MKLRSRCTLFAVLIIMIFTTGFNFGKKDETYFRKHPEKAISKFTNCEKVINRLAEVGNIKKLEEVVSDPECIAANKVVQEIKAEETKVKRNQRLKEEAAKKSQRKKEKSEKTAQTEILLEKHYKLYPEIPLQERVSGKGLFIDAWSEECSIISRSRSDCKKDMLGKSIYEKSYKKYSTDTSAKEKRFEECRGYEIEHYKTNRRKVFNERPHPYARQDSLRGANECHAAYDVIEDKLVEKFMAMPLEQRVAEWIKCDQSDYDDICSESLKKTKNNLAKIYEEKFSSDSNAKSLQDAECKIMQKELKQKGPDFMFIMRDMGECKAAK